MIYQEDLMRAKASQKSIRSFFQQLKRKKSADLDDRFHVAHEQVFSEIDCLQCANCCKTTSPIFIHSDIDRLAAGMRLKPGKFVEKYLKMDDDGDYVLQSSPCPFLLGDNTCAVYEDRPKACREYPHTNRKRMHQILNLTEKNAQVCPAVLRMVERLNSIG